MKNKNRHFVCAKVDGLVTDIRLTNERFPGYLNDKGVERFIEAICPRFLLSLGSVMSRNKPADTQMFDKFLRLAISVRNTPYLQGTELLIDNGGYQVQQGFLPADAIPSFVHQYYDLLQCSRLPVDGYFTLDIAPGKENVFESEKQLSFLNNMSYSLASRLPDNIRNKMLYVEHFRTLELIRVWEGLHKKGYHECFDNFGTGGLASAGRLNAQPCVDYVIPMVRALHDARERGLTRFRYHVFGSSSLHYLLFHSVFEHHIRKVHGISVEITCDSTIIFSRFCRSYSLPVVDLQTKNIHPILLKSATLNDVTPFGLTNLAAFVSLANTLLTPYGIRELEPKYSTIYQPRKYKGEYKDSLTKLAYTYGIFLYMNSFYVVEQWCREAVPDLYRLYELGNVEQFCNGTTSLLVQISESPLTPTKYRNIQAMTTRILNSLRMLETLDWDHSILIVDRFLTKRNAA